MSHTQAKRGRAQSVTKRLVLTAIFAALAYAAMFVFRFNVQFLTFDLKDAVITLSGLLLGPVTAFTVSLLVAFIELITISDTGWYGFIMNFASSAAFSVVCAVVYRYRKKLSGAVLGLIAAVAAMVALMMVLNLFVTPLYQGVSRSDIAALLPVLFLPFNAVKGMANAAVVLVLYKPVYRAMQAARLLPRTDRTAVEAPDPAAKRANIIRNICVTVGGLLLLAAAVAVVLLLLDGRFELFKER